MNAALQAELLAARDVAAVERAAAAKRNLEKSHIPELLEAFETLTGIDPRAHTREEFVVKARHIFCLILSDRGLSKQEIAAAVGLNRATIFNCIEKAHDLVSFDKQSAYYYKTFEQIINKHYGK